MPAQPGPHERIQLAAGEIQRIAGVDERVTHLLVVIVAAARELATRP